MEPYLQIRDLIRRAWKVWALATDVAKLQDIWLSHI